MIKHESAGSQQNLAGEPEVVATEPVSGEPKEVAVGSAEGPAAASPESASTSPVEIATDPAEQTSEYPTRGMLTDPVTGAQYPRPRVRLAAITWGVIALLMGVGVLWQFSSDERRIAFLEWIGRLGFGGVSLLVLGLVGVVVLISGIAAVLRRTR